MKRDLIQIAIGASLLLMAFLAFGFTYRAFRYSLADDGSIVVLGKMFDPVWTPVSPPRAEPGFHPGEGFISNAVVTHGDSPQLKSGYSAMRADGSGVHVIHLDSDAPTPIRCKLLSRAIVNRFGTKLVEWDCSASGAIAPGSKQYFLSLNKTGGGDAGFAIQFNGEHRRETEFTLTIIEQHWSNLPRQCQLSFRVMPDGKIQHVAAP
jgi:hypothetical protein